MGRPTQKMRVASLHDDAYARFVRLLVQRRRAAGMSQQFVADQLGWNQSIIAKIETAQRRIDIVELVRLAGVVGFDPAKIVRELRAILIETGEIIE